MSDNQSGDVVEISNQVKKVIAEHLSLKVEEVQEDKNIASDLGADSLDTVELVMALEEMIDKEIPDEDAEQLKTVQEVIDYVVKRKAEDKAEAA